MLFPGVCAPITARCVALIVACVLLPWSGGIATEPDGHVRFHPEWIDSLPEGTRVDPDHRILRITIEPIVPLTGIVLTATFPPDVPARVLTPPRDGAIGHSSPGLPHAITMTVGSLDPGITLTVDLDVAPPGAGGGTASFTVTARRADGRLIREAVGVAVGDPSGKGSRRHGAMEFPSGSGGEGH